MKKKFILAIFGISLLFMACQEDSYYNDYDMGDENSSILTETMKLIDDNYTNVTLPDLGKTLGGNTTTRGLGGKKYSMSLDDEAFTFDWSNAEIISSSKAEAVIVPVKQNRGVALQSVVAKGNVSREETTPLYSILYVRKFLDDGKSYAHILSFAPDRDYANTCEERGEEMQLYPNPQGSNYSGILFVSTIYGEISHGIRYENGRMCHYILPRSERNRDFIEKYRSGHAECHEHCDSTHMHTRMSMNFITFNSATRSTYSTQSENGSGYNCSICGKDVYDCTCVEIVACGVCKQDPCVCYDGIEGEQEDRCAYCAFPKEACTCTIWPPDFSGGSNNNGGTTGGSSSGNNGSSGNTSGDTSITTSPFLTNIGKWDPSFNLVAKLTLNKLIPTWYNKNIFNQSMYRLFFNNINVYGKLTFKIDPNINVGTYSAKTISIAFINSSSICYNIFAEEFIHATQHNSFYHSDMAAMGKRAELEAKIMIDLIAYLSGEIRDFYVLTQNLEDSTGLVQDDYIEWIEGNNYSNYSEKFDEWLNYFKYRGEPNDSVTDYKMFEWLYDNCINK